MAPLWSAPVVGVLALLVLSGSPPGASAAREAHVITGFRPTTAAEPEHPGQHLVQLQTVQQAQQQQQQVPLAHRVDAQPSDPVDVGDDGVPGYGLNGGHGDLTPWLPSQPTWQLPLEQQLVPQVQQHEQVQQVQQQVTQVQQHHQQVQHQKVPQVQQQYQQVQQQVSQVQQQHQQAQQVPQVQHVAAQDADDSNMMRVIHRPGSGPTPTAHYIVNRPPAGDRIDTLVDTVKPQQPQKKPGRPPTGASGAPGAVSETDMYLLGAIEKLVYRVDHLEKRLRRTEELVYYLMEGAGNKQEAAEPCPKDFTRAGRHCYHFSGRDLNWKSASSACKAMDSILVEVVTPEDKRDLVNWITAHQEFRGRDFWTGGLNPGLLWIWANSARPVSSSAHNGTSTNAIKNPGEDIPGNGRCLKLAHNPATRQYHYHGGDCSTRFRFICQLEDPSASRALSRIHKSLNIRLDGDSNPPPTAAAVASGP